MNGIYKILFISYKKIEVNLSLIIKASRSGKIQTVELLLKYGANTNLRDMEGDTALIDGKMHDLL